MISFPRVDLSKMPSIQPTSNPGCGSIRNGVRAGAVLQIFVVLFIDKARPPCLPSPIEKVPHNDLLENHSSNNKKDKLFMLNTDYVQISFVASENKTKRQQNKSKAGQKNL